MFFTATEEPAVLLGTGALESKILDDMEGSPNRRLP